MQESRPQPSNTREQSWLRSFLPWCWKLGWKWWLEFILVGACGVALSLHFEESDLLIETRYRFYNWVQSWHLIPPTKVTKTAVLLINDREYWNPNPEYPAGRAPIRRDYLAHLITTLASLPDPPQVIGLDFDFRAEHPQQIADGKSNSNSYQPEAQRQETCQLAAAIQNAIQTNPKTRFVVSASVWKQAGRYFEEANIYDDPELTLEHCNNPAPPAHSDATGRPTVANAATPSTPAWPHTPALAPGFIALPHQTWRFPLPLVTDQHSGDMLLPPFSWAVAKQADTFEEPEKEVPFAPYIGLSGWLGNKGAEKLLEGDDLAENDPICELTQPSCRTVLASTIHPEPGKWDASIAAGLFANKVVLIGGDWHSRALGRGDFADRYLTPAGKIPGVFIHADYVEGFLNGRFITPAAKVFLITLDVLLALALALSLKRAEQLPQPTLPKQFLVSAIKLLCVAGFVSVTFVLGFIAIRRWHYFFDFTIIALGVVAHYAYDSVEWPWRKREHERTEEDSIMTIPPAAPKRRSRKKNHSRKAAAPIIAAILFLGTLTSSRAYAGPQKETSSGASPNKTSTPSQRAEQKQKYSRNDIDVEKPGGARGGKPKWVVVQMMNSKGDNIGRATVTGLKDGGVDVKLDLGDLPPGEHALHFHQVAKCDAPDFKSAGPHFNPEKKEHGLKNPKGPHAGDMENFSVGSDGITTATVHNPNVTLRGKNSLLANGGTALVIHAKPDDMKTDPAGNAGDRVACGVIAEP